MELVDIVNYVTKHPIATIAYSIVGGLVSLALIEVITLPFQKNQRHVTNTKTLINNISSDNYND